MDKKLSVTGIANNLKSSKKPKFLTKIFRKLVLNKFSNMKKTTMTKVVALGGVSKKNIKNLIFLIVLVLLE